MQECVHKEGEKHDTMNIAWSGKSNQSGHKTGANWFEVGLPLDARCILGPRNEPPTHSTRVAALLVYCANLLEIVHDWGGGGGQ